MYLNKHLLSELLHVWSLILAMHNLHLIPYVFDVFLRLSAFTIQILPKCQVIKKKFIFQEELGLKCGSVICSREIVAQATDCGHTVLGYKHIGSWS